jgi:hypothetical protein
MLKGEYTKLWNSHDKVMAKILQQQAELPPVLEFWMHGHDTNIFSPWRRGLTMAAMLPHASSHNHNK